MTVVTENRSLIRTGRDYRESLRDGREVWYRGDLVEDVTTHPATAGLVDVIAKLYDDDQHAPETSDILTYVRNDGTRVATSWLTPRVPEDLARPAGVLRAVRVGDLRHGRPRARHDLVDADRTPRLPAYPVAARGDEMDSLVVLEDVFVPRERVFC